MLYLAHDMLRSRSSPHRCASLIRSIVEAYLIIRSSPLPCYAICPWGRRAKAASNILHTGYSAAVLYIYIYLYNIYVWFSMRFQFATIWQDMTWYKMRWDDTMVSWNLLFFSKSLSVHDVSSLTSCRTWQHTYAASASALCLYSVKCVNVLQRHER